MKRFLIAAGLVMAAACSSMARPADEAAGPATNPDADLCHASQYQHLVGRKMTDLPPKPEGAVWRQACTQCPVTMDFNPNRMNIFFDKDSEVIRQIRCG
jgi:hypothetical protein